ncbi:hypothetical protein [Mucilaginibacter sp.]|uniref:hypothetical protein n=1 Tax=Mucilaginibacter sp. TaxID=1882438 RepID=UPI0026247F65|nr:hypothetical protein [Mucilaginibacter sp.]
MQLLIGDQTEIRVRTGIMGISGENQSIRLQAGEQLLATPGKNWHKPIWISTTIPVW